MRTTRQPSLFGVEASHPTPDDLVGLLAGPGELGRLGGTVRVCVEVGAAWRVHVLIGELGRRSLPASWEPAGDRYTVRTAYTTRLLPLARAWTVGGGAWRSQAGGEAAGPPAGLHLNGQALRLWVAAAGEPSPDGYLLGLCADDGEAGWAAAGAALHAAGLAAALVAPCGRGAGLPAYRITGRRRLARLAELVGDPPLAAPPDTWPVI